MEVVGKCGRHYLAGCYERDVPVSGATIDRLYLGGTAYNAPVVLTRVKGTDTSAISKKLTSMDLAKNSSMKVGGMHIRRGIDALVKAEAYGGVDPTGKILVIGKDHANIHFDRIGAVLFPITHWIVDSQFQKYIWGVK